MVRVHTHETRFNLDCLMVSLKEDRFLQFAASSGNKFHCLMVTVKECLMMSVRVRWMMLGHCVLLLLYICVCVRTYVCVCVSGTMYVFVSGPMIGHVGDGNFHIFFPIVSGDVGQIEAVERVSHEICV